MKYTLNGNEIKSQESVLGAIGAGIATLFASIASAVGAMVLAYFILIGIVCLIVGIAMHADEVDLKKKRQLAEEIKAKIPKEVWDKFVKDVLTLLKDVEKSSKNAVNFCKEQIESIPNVKLVSDGKINTYNSKSATKYNSKNVQNEILKNLCAEIISSICSEKEFSLTGLAKRNGILDVEIGCNIKEKYYFSELKLEEAELTSPDDTKLLQELRKNVEVFKEFQKGVEVCCSKINNDIISDKLGSGYVKCFSKNKKTYRNDDDIFFFDYDALAVFIYGDLDFVFDETKIKAMIAPIVKIIKENSNTNGDK